MLKITHPCAFTAQPGKGQVLLLTSEIQSTTKSANELSVTRLKGDGNYNDDDDVSNHLIMQTHIHIHLMHRTRLKVFKKR